VSSAIAVPTGHYVVLAALLFCLGVACVLLKRNPVVIFMGVELMLNSANLLLVAFGRHFASQGAMGAQAFVLLVMAVAAAEVSVGLGIIVAIFKTKTTVDVDEMSLMKW
jgi:NADH-quinone oxidoreductase subunit K